LLHCQSSCKAYSANTILVRLAKFISQQQMDQAKLKRCLSDAAAATLLKRATCKQVIDAALLYCMSASCRTICYSAHRPQTSSPPTNKLLYYQRHAPYPAATSH
jgi:hypothetical protein